MVSILQDWLIKQGFKRPADVVIMRTDGDVYLKRWHLIPRNRFFNVYLHMFNRSDDDRALHDHPWINASFLLSGQYVEHTIGQGGVHHRQVREESDLVVRMSGKCAHRIELVNGPVWTLFVTGPRYRQWGFHCPLKGWVHHLKFTNPQTGYPVGKGCE